MSRVWLWKHSVACGTASTSCTARVQHYFCHGNSTLRLLSRLRRCDAAADRYDTFGDCGEIEGIHWVTDKTTGNFYGTAFVDFKEHEAAKAAVKRNGAEILGRMIKVESSVHQRFPMLIM